MLTTASPPAGFYATPVTVTLTCDDPLAVIYYTLDGSDPALLVADDGTALLADDGSAFTADGE